ncbi:adenylate/guanylate cyclase domain-containing protein [Jeotgalibacillus salarius]|uniref:Adenylate/guanylate cyclase domain-containing protein n=1 Tax=Jeotgalibacillus salarius TaxID=546023 RepID=A0A4Y8LFX5_9BACL|nr:adenylate/guanylate cyclase domain-containing protein [Jeotgalibacillus salarius]TFD99416.1 adenylate/guanylate cyclase domain-containing protein [Jeotgalibacillus salarius]
MKLINYPYKSRKQKVEEILDNTDAVKEDIQQFPRDEDFTYTNGYKAWATSIFVDLRESTKLFTEYDDVEIAKVIRGFTSEIIEILRDGLDDKELKEIGIRGDCVYAVYSTPFQEDIREVATRAFYVNTYMRMLNTLLTNRTLPNIRAGIGLATSETLAVKAGRKNTGINNLVWIGKSVANAAKLSDLGNKEGRGPIVMSDIFYTNMIEIELKIRPESKMSSWFTKPMFEDYYHGYVVINDFNEWLNNGME